MSTTKDGGPAFPVQALAEPGSEIVWGMSLRDWFAGQALMGWAAGRSDEEAFMPGNDDGDWEAEACYRYADAMLRARESGKEGHNDDAWALDAAVTIHPAVGTESIHPTTWTARYWDGVRTLEESAPTIHAALRALRAKVEGGGR